MCDNEELLISDFVCSSWTRALPSIEPILMVEENFQRGRITSEGFCEHYNG